MASSVNSLLGASSTPSSTNPSSSSTTSALTSAAPNEQMFLQLLVSQLQNQDPLNPTDSTQFVSQLAQFSQLEQVIAIRGDIETAMANQSGAAGTGTSGTSGSGTASQTNANGSSSNPSGSSTPATQN